MSYQFIEPHYNFQEFFPILEISFSNPTHQHAILTTEFNSSQNFAYKAELH
jgi:hypothetical protein